MLKLFDSTVLLKKRKTIQFLQFWPFEVFYLLIHDITLQIHIITELILFQSLYSVFQKKWKKWEGEIQLIVINYQIATHLFRQKCRASHILAGVRTQIKVTDVSNHEFSYSSHQKCMTCAKNYLWDTGWGLMKESNILKLLL